MQATQETLSNNVPTLSAADTIALSKQPVNYGLAAKGRIASDSEIVIAPPIVAAEALEQQPAVAEVKAEAEAVEVDQVVADDGCFITSTDLLSFTLYLFYRSMYF